MHIGLKIFIWGVLGLVVFGALLFGPAGTFDYWQAWVFLAAFVSTTIGPTIYLARNDPAALPKWAILCLLAPLTGPRSKHPCPRRPRRRR